MWVWYGGASCCNHALKSSCERILSSTSPSKSSNVVPARVARERRGDARRAGSCGAPFSEYTSTPTKAACTRILRRGPCIFQWLLLLLLLLPAAAAPVLPPPPPAAAAPAAAAPAPLVGGFLVWDLGWFRLLLRHRLRLLRPVRPFRRALSRSLRSPETS